MGGVETLGYYLYGAYPGASVPVDWATYGWGTPAWKEVITTVVHAHKSNGLIMDAALGPNQGAGVPAETDSDGLLWDLRMATVSVSGSSFNGTVPGWATGTLQAAVFGRVTSSVNTTGPAPGLFGASPSAYGSYRIQNTLATNSLRDITGQVGQDGTLALEVDATNAGNWTLFAFYLVHSELYEQEPSELLTGPQTTPMNFMQNGSWTVDHFSALGAQTTVKFWEQYLLDDEVRALLADIGNYVWEDSVEIDPTVYWTRYLPQAFQANRGYSINKWLPLIHHESSPPSYAAVSGPEPVWYITDKADAGNKHIGDYRETLDDH